MNYEELYHFLNVREYDIHKTITVTLTGEKLSGLWIPYTFLDKYRYLDKLRNDLPIGYSATYFPNLGEIHIKKSN